jgi:hypothetical protein
MDLVGDGFWKRFFLLGSGELKAATTPPNGGAGQNGFSVVFEAMS